ncbi:MAG TPA: NADPH-dependent FMN reductase [Roseiflexaceae bacterium]|nr:NADPH-dependent FMN reductase [Roseiflexaceae bacterium]
MHVLGISGSLRKASWNSGLLRAAGELLPEGMSLEIVDLRDIPLYNQDHDGPNAPEAVIQLKQRIRAADALLIATPEYNGSMPGVLKNAIDWVSRPANDSPFSGKPLAIMGAGGISGTIRAQLALRQVAASINTFPLNRPQIQITRAWEKFDAEGNLTDEQSRQEIRAQLEALAAWTRRLRGE